MRIDPKRNYPRRDRPGGFSLIELLIVVFVVMVIAAIAVPNILSAVSNIRLRASAGDLAGLMQQARGMAAKNNTPYVVLYGTRNGAQIAYIRDPSSAAGLGNFVTGEPMIEFSGTTVPASGAPSGSGGQPSAYVLAGDTGTGSYDNTSTLGYTGRGLPCNYDTTLTPACSTPPPKYFVYYLTDTRIAGAGWAAVVVTKGGRAKIVTWNGGAWN
jgi:type II secretory pathway pseudopilin PulG